MKLERMHLYNFRCFDELTVEFGDRLTVISAENGSGKTALLDAVAIGFGRYLTNFPNIPGRSIQRTDRRVDSWECLKPFMMLSWEAITRDAQRIRWTERRKKDSTVSAATIKNQLSEEQLDRFKWGCKNIDDYAQGMVQSDHDQVENFLPVIAYYGTNRAIHDEMTPRHGSKKNFSRFDALSGALDPDSRFRVAFEWFQTKEDMERREREKRRDFAYRHPELQAVRSAMVRLLGDDFSNPRTEIDPLRFVIDQLMADGRTQTLRISQLSDGSRAVLGLAMDLARRMAQANSQIVAQAMGVDNPLDLPAIALIDEVDLHLNPSWQQRVLTDLMLTFSQTQFIVTTHSPQVLSTVHRENIRIIGPDSSGRVTAAPPLSMTYGEPSGDLLHSVMMVDPQPPVREKTDLLRLTEWVDQGQYDCDQARQLMTDLIAALGIQHPQLQRLQRSIQRQKAMQA